jgi:hypothetical protein
VLSAFGKFLFVLSALAPLSFAYAIDAWVHRSEWKSAVDWQLFFTLALSLGIALPLICAAIVRGIQVYGQEEPLTTTEVKTADKEVLTFLIVYLLPIISKDFVGIYSSPVLAIYVIGIIAWAVFHGNAFSFNPLLALFGYHFYEVKNAAGIPYLLITRRTVRQAANNFRVVNIADYIYLDKG